MSESDQIAGLLGWQADGEVSLEAVQRMLSHARFPRAARTLAMNMQAAAEKDKALDGIMKDAGRYIAAMGTVYLHLTGGLTLPRLKELCAASGFVSPGRARAILLYLRYLGYVEFLSGRPRGEPVRYLPTQRFMSTWRGHLDAALAAASVIEPGVEPLRKKLRVRKIFETFARTEADMHFHEARASDLTNDAYARVILHRHAGTQIIWSLLIAGGDDDAFPARNAIPFSIADAARRFGVSRVHVRRLLDAAKQEGLLNWEKDGEIFFEERGRASIEFIYALQLIQLLRAAAATIADLPDSMRTPSQIPRRSRAPAELNLS